jgi:error-prone DNA polymerase
VVPADVCTSVVCNSVIVVWRDLANKQRRVLLAASLMAVEGIVERKGEVIHVIAKRLIDHSGLLGNLVIDSRDFHSVVSG